MLEVAGHGKAVVLRRNVSVFLPLALQRPLILARSPISLPLPSSASPARPQEQALGSITFYIVSFNILAVPCSSHSAPKPRLSSRAYFRHSLYVLFVRLTATMPPAYTAAQKNAIASFVGITNSDRTSAARVSRPFLRTQHLVLSRLKNDCVCLVE